MLRAVVLSLVLAIGCEAQIVVSPAAAPLEKFAAAELASYLSKLYPGLKQLPHILVGTVKSNPEIGRYVGREKLEKPESFVVTHNRNLGIIAGADARGTLYGVYALLEKLGCGFYLSNDSLPAPRQTFSFDAWQLSDAPLYADRMVFNWHNFLSSASTWELGDWQRYIDQSTKMRYNTLMVHAYGNNPMFTFRYNGQEKPVGYLATTKSGRDWGTQHVNDVRRMMGGEIFKDPVFGASIAKVADDQRAAAAIGLMKQVFTYAQQHGMGITFALDVDTVSANPQNIANTLPASARLTDGKFQLVNPETPEGHAYYKSQLQQLLALYPQITRLAVWSRTGGTPWRNLKLSDLPQNWQSEFNSILEKKSWLKEDKSAVGMFAVSKITRTVRNVLREVGRSDIELAFGSWNLTFVRTADAFMPREATMIPLDWGTIFDTQKGLDELRMEEPGRKLIPIIWAHHDDRTYIGRPYTPYNGLSTLLKERKSNGFGIIHWTTRPLDMYFKSSAVQVWSATANQPLRQTCEQMAATSFGASAKATGADYLLSFVTDGPMFGRETSDRFIDVALKEPEAVIAKARERIAKLARINESESLAYFRGYEEFILAFFESHAAWERAQQALKRGAIPEATTEIAKCNAESVIKKYVQSAKQGQISRGEEALIVSLNLRWLPYVVSLRQALALEPVRLKFGPTQHEALAQGPGHNTFHFDAQRQVWKTLGEKETTRPTYEFSGETGVRFDQPFKIRLAPITGDKLIPGAYRVQLRLLDREPATVEFLGKSTRLTGTNRIVTVEQAATINNGFLELEIRPTGGTVYLSGAVLLR